MCHLCRKVENLQTVDSNLIKPICILLAKLHKHAEPHLGDLWLWRHEKTTELRNLLTIANTKLPNKALKSMAEDVEKELVHIKCNMRLHPPRRSTGRWDALKTYIEPKDSVSNNVSKSSQDDLRAGRTERRRRAVGGVEGEGRSKRATEGSREETTKHNSGNTRPPTQEDLNRGRISPTELSGSDLDPSPAVMEQSSRKVAEWLIQCNEAANAKDDYNDDTNSLVSFVDGGLVERPDLDVKIWSRVCSLTMKLPGSRCRKSGSSSGKTHCKGSRITVHLSDCIYDDPLHKLKQDERIIKKVDKIAINKARRQFFNNLSSRLYLKMGESLSRKKNIPLDKAVRMVKVDDKRGEHAVYMTGGRSEGRDMLASTEASFGGENDMGRPSFGDGRRDLFALTWSEYGECVERAAGGLTNTSSRWHSEAESSNRDSVVKMGPVIRLPERAKKTVRVIPRDTARPRRPGDSSSEDSFTPTAPEPVPIKRSLRSSPKAMNVRLAHQEDIGSRSPVVAMPINIARPCRTGDILSEDLFTPTAPEPGPVKKSLQHSPKIRGARQAREDQIEFRRPIRAVIRDTARPRRLGDDSSESSFTPTAPEPVPIKKSSQVSSKTTILRQAREEQLRRGREYAAEKIAEERINPTVFRWEGRDYHKIESPRPERVNVASIGRQSQRGDTCEANQKTEIFDPARKRRIERAAKTTQADNYNNEERQKLWHKK